jgi:hypothetical protein
MTTLSEIREQIPLSELCFQQAMAELETLVMDYPETGINAIAAALGYHREVCALHAAELSLIGNGTIG